MKKQLTIILGIIFSCMPLLAQQDTVRSLIISEYQGGGVLYTEFTNVGEDSVDLSRFTWQVQNWNAGWTFDGPSTYSPGHGPTWMGGPVRLSGETTISLKNLPLYLQAGESFVIIRVYDAAYDNPEARNYGWTKNRPGFFDIDHYVPCHLAEPTDTLFPYRPELEMWGLDSIGKLPMGAQYERISLAGSGSSTGALYYILDNGDSVLVDQIGVKEDPIRTGTTLDIPADIAGVYQAQYLNHLVRKLYVKEGTWNWDLSRGIDNEDSQWWVLPRWDSWKIPTTVGSHGDFPFSLTSESVDINTTDTTITVPWGIFKGDSILDEFTFGPGMSWQYLEDTLSFEDSAYMRVQDGDIFNVYAVGNEMVWMAFEVKVADPSQDMALIFPKRKLLPPEDVSEPDYVGPLWGGAPYSVTEDNPVIDTILNIPFGCRVDTLLKYLDKAPAATWKIEYVDGMNRADLMYGDKLVVTAEDGSRTKEYFIKAVTAADYNKLNANHDASLAAITWPGIPGFIEGWKGDTIPSFSPSKTSYSIILPAGTAEIPALQVVTNNLNARVTEDRATLLRGSATQRTTTYTVTAEDDSITSQYTVTFSIEKPREKRQLYRAEPIWSEIIWPRTAGFVYEIANVGDYPLDLSSYLIINEHGQKLNPADAISSRAIAPQYASRYMRSLVPGFRYTNNEASYDIEKGFLFYDAAVDPVVEPGDVFVILSAHRTANIFSNAEFMENCLPNADVINNYSVNWELGEGWNINSRGDKDVNNLFLYNWTVMFMYHIDNDSILEGRKAIGDPEDFTLIDFSGDYTKPSWTGNYYGGKSANGTSNTRVLRVWRKPEAVFPHADLDTTWMQTEWQLANRADYADLAAALGVAPDYAATLDVGSHTFDPVTIHMSTVSSVAYLVSDGYEGDLTIQGHLTSTTLSQLLGNIYKVNPEQSLTLHSGTDGSERSAEDNIAEGDTLVVVSADETNTSNYLLVNDPLDDNAMLTVKSAYTSKYTVTVDGNMGTVTGTGVTWGKPLKEVLSSLSKPATANLNVIDQNGRLISKQMTNYDTVPVDVQVNDSIYIEVVAQNGVDKILYRIVPASMASDAFVVSSVFLVDQENMTISLIPEGIGVQKILENVQAVTGAKASIIDKFGIERKIALLTIDDKLKVVSQDGTKTVYYYLNFFNEMMADYNLPPSLSVAFNDTNIVINTTISLVAMAEDDDMPLPTNLSVLWEVLSGEGVSIASPDQLTTDVSFTALGSVVLQVTVDDGEISKSETVNVGVVSPNNIAPTVAVAFADTTILEGATISVGGTADDDGNPIGSSLSYAWTVTLGNAANVSIATADQLTSDVTFSTPGVYSLKVTVSDGEAVASDLIVVVVNSTVGVEPVMVPGLNMYPNPASKQLTLEFLNTGAASSTVKIYGITGRAVYNAEHMQSKVRIDVSDFDAGVYFVAVKSGDYSVTRKLQIVK